MIPLPLLILLIVAIVACVVCAICGLVLCTAAMELYEQSRQHHARLVSQPSDSDTNAV